MKDEIRVTVIATGFERADIARPLFEKPFKAVRQGSEIDVPAPPVQHEMSEAPRPATPSAPTEEFKPRTFNTDDLDIPTFLRKRNR